MADEQKPEQVEEKAAPVEDKAVEEKSEPTISQSELDQIIERRLARERIKTEKMYGGIDPDEAKALKKQADDLKLKEQKEKGEFELILKEQAEKSNAEISNLKKEIEKIKIDGELINSASKNKAINPNQVSDLIRPNLRLDDNGRVEVLDENKKTRYNKNGDPLSIDEAVNEFITQNPHFQAATPSGSGSVGNVGKENPKPFKLGDLDMTNPEDRKRYAEYKKERDSKPTVINLTNRS
tara:strand:+ start:1633 stop:2346 length:714 start_codon:yes stop_codon:yes gene_type:complete